MSTNREVSQLHVEVGVDADDKRRVSGVQLEVDIDDTSSMRRVSGLLLEVDILANSGIAPRKSLLGVGV